MVILQTSDDSATAKLHELTEAMRCETSKSAQCESIDEKVAGPRAHAKFVALRTVSVWPAGPELEVRSPTDTCKLQPAKTALQTLPHTKRVSIQNIDLLGQLQFPSAAEPAAGQILLSPACRRSAQVYEDVEGMHRGAGPPQQNTTRPPREHVKAKVGTREFLLPKCAPPGHTNRALAAHDHTIRRQMYISDKRKKKAQISPGQGLKESSGSILGSDEDSGNVAVEYSSAKNYAIVITPRNSHELGQISLVYSDAATETLSAEAEVEEIHSPQISSPQPMLSSSIIEASSGGLEEASASASQNACKELQSMRPPGVPKLQLDDVHSSQVKRVSKKGRVALSSKVIPNGKKEGNPSTIKFSPNSPGQQPTTTRLEDNSFASGADSLSTKNSSELHRELGSMPATGRQSQKSMGPFSKPVMVSPEGSYRSQHKPVIVLTEGSHKSLQETEASHRSPQETERTFRHKQWSSRQSRCPRKSSKLVPSSKTSPLRTSPMNARTPSPVRRMSVIGMIPTDEGWPQESVETKSDVNMRIADNQEHSGNQEHVSSGKDAVAPGQGGELLERALEKLRVWGRDSQDESDNISDTASEGLDPVTITRALPARLVQFMVSPRHKEQERLLTPNTSREEQLCQWEDSARQRERARSRERALTSTQVRKAAQQSRGSSIFGSMSEVSQDQSKAGRSKERTSPFSGTSSGTSRHRTRSGSVHEFNRVQHTVTVSSPPCRQEAPVSVVSVSERPFPEIPVGVFMRGGKIRNSGVERHGVLPKGHESVHRQDNHESNLIRVPLPPQGRPTPRGYFDMLRRQGVAPLEIEWGTGMAMQDVSFEEVEEACNIEGDQDECKTLVYYPKQKVRGTGRRRTTAGRLQVKVDPQVYEDKIVKFINQREHVLKKLQKALGKFSKGESDPEAAIRCRVSTLLLDLRAYSVFFVEALSKWNRACGTKSRVFVWNDVDYLQKLLHDTEFLESYSYLSENLCVQGTFSISFAPLKDTNEDEKHAMQVPSGYDIIVQELLVNSPPLADQQRITKAVDYLRSRNERVRFKIEVSEGAYEGGAEVLSLNPSVPSTAASDLHPSRALSRDSRGTRSSSRPGIMKTRSLWDGSFPDITPDLKSTHIEGLESEVADTQCETEWPADGASEFSLNDKAFSVDSDSKGSEAPSISHAKLVFGDTTVENDDLMNDSSKRKDKRPARVVQVGDGLRENQNRGDRWREHRLRQHDVASTHLDMTKRISIGDFKRYLGDMGMSDLSQSMAAMLYAEFAEHLELADDKVRPRATMDFEKFRLMFAQYKEPTQLSPHPDASGLRELSSFLLSGVQ